MKKKALVIVLLAGFVVVIGVVGFLFIKNNNKINKKIQGAWSLQSMDVGIGERRRTRDDAEFMLYIMEKNYSAIRDFTPGDTDGKMLALSDRDFAADAGTYELDGYDLIVSHKLSSFPVLGSMTFTWTLEDDSTLILEPQYDKMVLPGLDIHQPKTGKWDTVTWL